MNMGASTGRASRRLLPSLIAATGSLSPGLTLQPPAVPALLCNTPELLFYHSILVAFCVTRRAPAQPGHAGPSCRVQCWSWGLRGPRRVTLHAAPCTLAFLFGLMADCRDMAIYLPTRFAASNLATYAVPHTRYVLSRFTAFGVPSARPAFASTHVRLRTGRRHSCRSISICHTGLASCLAICADSPLRLPGSTASPTHSWLPNALPAIALGLINVKPALSSCPPHLQTSLILHTTIIRIV